MQGRLLVRTGRLFDSLENRWERLATQKNIATVLVSVFVFGLLLIELGRQGLPPSPIQEDMPTNHFVAILFPFTLLLLIEVISLVFALTAPRFVDAVLGVTATLFTIALTRVYNLVESRESEATQ